MAVKVIDRKYFNQFNDDIYYTDWLLGNVGDWQRLELTFEASVDFFPSQSESVTVDSVNNSFILNNGGKWSDYGFDIGDSVAISVELEATNDDGDTEEANFVGNVEIVNLYGDTMETDGVTSIFDAIIFNFDILPTDRGDFKVHNVSFSTQKEPEGVKFNYSHISNEDFESLDIRSFVDSTKTIFSFAGLQNLTTGVYESMNPDSLQSGMSIENASIKKVADKTYTVRLDFMLGVIFESISDFEDNSTPILFNEGSLTDNFEIEVFPEWNNPNTVIRNDLTHTSRLGNTGWFNENFNALDNDFQVNNLKYFDENGLPLDQLDYSATVIMEVEVTGIQNLSDISRFNLGFSWLPEDTEDYFNKETSYHKNLLVNTPKKYDDGAFGLGQDTSDDVFEGNSFGDAKMNIVAHENIMFTALDETTVKVRARFEPNNEFFNFFEERNDSDKKYVIWVSVADYDLEINFSNRVSLIVDYNTMIKVVPPAGPLEGMINKFIEHPRDEYVSGVDKYYGHIEDDVLCRVNFSLDNTKKFIQNIVFGYEIENLSTGSSYVLQEFSNNTSVFPYDSNGVQQINIDKIRGFKLVNGNNKNFVKVYRNESLDSDDKVAYECFFGSKIRWEDWITRTGVPEEFFNNDLLNDGYHNNWLDYLRNNGDYNLNFYVSILVEEDGELKTHKNTFELEVNGYDENLNITSEHNYYRDSDNTLLNVGVDPSTGKTLGVILSNEKTRIEITYTNLVEDFDFDKLYCVISLEIENGPGQFEYRQLSSKWLSEPDNPLRPFDGEDNLRVESIDTNIAKSSCLIDPGLLESASRYKITGRIGCAPEGTDITVVTDGVYEKAYEQSYE